MIKKKGVFTKSLAFSMALAMTVTNLPANLFSSVTDSDLEALSNVSAASTEYGLADDIDDGVILHAWNWSFDQIKAELPKIAAAGFTSIQTSPAQPNKDGNSVSKTSQWWKFYQPTDFTIGNKLGTKTDLTELCKEADKYGIKIIVDVVANHLANNTGKEGNSASDRSTQIPDWIRNNNNFWHSDNFSGSSDGNRYQMTRGPIGMPDLNTANSELQDYIIKYLNDLQDCGVDGFRFDAAKHIETPSDTGFSSKFWSKVKSATQAKDSDVFLYGEILNTAGPGGYSDVQKYTPYIKVTNNLYGHSIQSSVGNWNAGYAKTLSGYNSNGQNIFGTNGNEWVLWNESHDTYAGDYGDKTNGYSDEQMTMAWCAVAARYSTALYYVRPTGDSNWGSSALGSHKMTYTDERIGAMNRFHNYFADQKEYASTSDNVLVVERGTTGVALINYNRGSKQVSIKMNRMVDGTYKDQISGNTFTVSNGVLTGKIGSGGVAAIYNAKPVATEPNATISKEGGNFSTDTLELTVGLKNATSGTYQIGNGSVKTFTSSKTITIGADMSYGDSVTVKLTATDGKNNYSKSYTFTKVEQTGNVAYLSLPSGWGSPVYCYAYDSATGKINNGTWPGQKMKKDSETGYYVYEVPENIEKPRVIFYNSDSNRTPGSMEDGYLLEEEGSYLYKDGKWSQYTAPVSNGTVTVKYVDENGNAIASAEKLTGKVGTSYSTSAVTVAGYTLSKTPSNAKGTYTKESITVTYVYTKEVDNTPKVTTSLADGSTFKSESEVITLYLENADSGVYCVDDGPVRTFTDSEVGVEIGRGKIADSTVTVKATAVKDGTSTEYTFTYYKEFNGTVDVRSTMDIDCASIEAAASAGSTFASNYYKTNATGTGSEKTIKSASDWSASDMIAQGVANDDSNVFKGPHEYPVYDEYALYAAYDDANLYIGWQYVNVRDVVASDQQGAGTNEAKPYNAPIPQMLAFDLGSAKGAYSTGGMDTDSSKRVWGINVDYDTNVNAIMCFDSKPGNGTPALFTTDSKGKFSYEDKYCNSFKTLGITYKHEDGLFAGVTSLNGIKGNGYTGYTPDALLSNSSAWTDLAKGHNKNLDTFYTITIPYSALGIDKNYIKTNGIGVMHISTYGESGVASIPADASMYDNATESYSKDGSSTKEKEDTDVITTSLARIGKSGGSIIVPTDLELNFGADRSAPQEAGTSLRLRAMAEGGALPYTYKFYVDGTLVATKGVSGEAYTTWDATAGEHVIKCVVTDSNNKTVTSAKYFNVEGEVCNHSNKVVKNEKAATCTTTGYTGDTYCADCGALLARGITTQVLGHSWNNGVVTKQPTATESGIRTYTCTRCGTTKEEVIPPISCNHTNKVVKNVKAATCTEAGYTGDTYCADCNLLLASGTTTAALGHSWNNGVVTKQPTATEPGIKTYTCNSCGTTKTETIPPYGTCNHSYVIQNQVAVTCTQNGYTGDVYCGSCGDLLIQGQVIPAIDHVWDDGVVTIEATATTDGVLTYHCVNCSETVEEPIPATGEEDGGDDEEISDELEVGDTVVVNKATYRITKLSDTNKTVEFVVSNSKATTVTVPKTITVEDTTFKVTAIASGAFKGSKTLKKVVIGSNVKTIGSNAFKNCKKLTTVSMGSNVTTIGASAFYNCTKLTSITIPANVKKIGKTAFYGCKKLATITINTTKLTTNNVGAKAFKNIKAKVAIKVPESKLPSYTTILKNKGVSAKATIAAKK